MRSKLMTIQAIRAVFYHHKDSGQAVKYLIQLAEERDEYRAMLEEEGYFKELVPMVALSNEEQIAVFESMVNRRKRR